ncbi:MAG: hypothetical protein JSV80_11285, partial [Acidobacteriota bacterium]
MLAISRLPLIFVAALLGAFVIVVVGCNETLDDPDISENIISIVSVEPRNACVDVDGDESGTFWSIEQTINFQSRLRGTTLSNFNDVVFTRVQFDYLVTNTIGNQTVPSRT